MILIISPNMSIDYCLIINFMISMLFSIFEVIFFLLILINIVVSLYCCYNVLHMQPENGDTAIVTFERYSLNFQSLHQLASRNQADNNIGAYFNRSNLEVNLFTLPKG